MKFPHRARKNPADMSVTIYTPLLVPLLDASNEPVRIPKFTYTGQAMAERKITATITSHTTLALVSGCYISFRGETFRLYETPAAKKTATSTTSQSAFEYTLVFYSAQHELATTDFIDIVSDTSHTYFNGGPIVDFVGTIPMLVERLQANLDRIYTGLNAWNIIVANGVDLLESAQISLTDSTVWDALMLVNTTENWGYKFHIRGHVITIGESGIIQDDVIFRYGKRNGLYEISRTNIDSSNLITRLRAYGGTQNIPSDYKKDGSGYVAPTYQYIKELSIPAYCYVSGATVNAVGKGNWNSSTQYAIGDLVRYDKKRFYARAVPEIGVQPPVFTSEWSATRMYMQNEMVTLGSLIYTCLNDSVGVTPPDVDPLNWEVNDWASWNEGYLQAPEASNDNWKGVWQDGTQYYTGDIISWDGLIYQILDYPPEPNAWPPSSVPFDLSVQYADGDRVRYNNRIWEFVSEDLSVVGEFPTEATWNIDESWGIWDRTYEELGIREGILRDESIYPTLKGMTYGGFAADDILAVSPVTSAEQVHFKVWIRDIGFNINDYLTSETPTFSITRGALAGYDFEIAKVETSTLAFSIGTAAYVLTLVRNSEDAFIVPDLENSIYQAVETISSVDYLIPSGSSASDYAKFLLTGISMPNIYVRAAEERLLERAQAYLAKYSAQQVTYAVGIDEIQAAKNDATWGDDGLLEGDFMGVIDTDMSIHGATVNDPKFIIVQSLTISVGDGMVEKYDVVLSDEPVSGTLDAIKSDIKEQGKVVELTGRRSSDDIRKEALSNLFLKAALAGDTEIDGGLLMTNLLLMRDVLTNEVTAGLSGIASDLAALWIGGTHTDAVNSIDTPSSVAGIDRKDGSGHRAFGKMLWDALGNLIINGGTIGNLSISGNALSSANMRFEEGPIETLAELKTAFAYTIARQASWNNVSSTPRTTASVYTQNIDISSRSMLRFKIDADAGVSTSTTIQVWNYDTNEVVWYDVLYNLSDMPKTCIVQMEAGTYYISATIEAVSSTVLNLYTYGFEDADVISSGVFAMRTKIGNNGYYSFWDDEHYFYYHYLTGLEAKNGAITFRQNGKTVSMIGLPTSDAGLSAGDLWRNGTAINIKT